MKKIEPNGHKGQASPRRIVPQPPSPALLWEDGEALVVDKPSGLPVTRPRSGAASLDDCLPALRLGFQRDPVAVHRLDQDTSGCLLLARNPKALARFGAAFEGGAVGKTYLALLDGMPRGDCGTIDLPLLKVSRADTGWRIVTAPGGKPARTHWRIVGQAGGRALVAFQPETGRTHQLRVHAATGLGLPILGDAVYGAGEPGGLMLHAWRLTVPRAGKPPIEAEAPLPARFVQAGAAPPG